MSGCVDVIVAEQADLSLKCSSFHVRFGKFKVLKSNEKEVIIKINDIEQSVHMKMDSSGKAYFEELVIVYYFYHLSNIQSLFLER